MAQHLSNFFCTKFQCEHLKARIPSWCGYKDTKSGLGLFMITLIKTKNCDSSLWKNFPCLHHGIFLHPKPHVRFHQPSQFSWSLPCHPRQLFPASLQLLVKDVLTLHHTLCSPGASGFFYLGPLNSWESLATHSIFFYLRFSAQLKKIKLISSVPSMLQGKPFYSSPP